MSPGASPTLFLFEDKLVAPGFPLEFFLFLSFRDTMCAKEERGREKIETLLSQHFAISLEAAKLGSQVFLSSQGINLCRAHTFSFSFLFQEIGKRKGRKCVRAREFIIPCLFPHLLFPFSLKEKEKKEKREREDWR